MKKKQLIWWHVAGWTAFSSVIFLPLFLYGFSGKILYTMISFLIYIGVFYLNLHLILPRWIRKRKTFYLLVSWVTLVMFCTLISIALNRILDVFPVNNDNYGLEILNAVLRNCLFIGFFLFISTAYQFTIDWFRNEKIKLELKNQNLKTELSFLKSQINPHFLFNTLNNIYILAYQRSGNAADAIMKLSEMMHYILYESSDEYVLLTKEIHHINQLIALQQLRVKDKMAFEFTVNGNTGHYTIAPLLLIAFVENIFKHSVLNEPDDPAIIKLCIENDQLCFYSRNKMNYALKDAMNGIGLSNVKRRLELLYPHRHHFEIVKDKNHYSVNLKIQLI